MKKNLMITATVLTVMILLAGCASAPAASLSPAPSMAPAATMADGKVFTIEELAKFDGTNGNPAYVAVDGVVYDVSDVPEWKGGNHQGRFTAGKDLTEEIKSLSPHGISKLKGLPVVGTLAR